ncbi:Wzz/FepE/Etk N-terminal domain-containing protein [Brumicola pallidula]|uniref:Lipopolysaccharide biosynthesis protein n=1 Tax=Brumicola pallidula DSM 14239 = ACAM 615 TaxID=1121922 RepID=K6ZHP0_9ALTE|nr:Wzz/FepE/Etk N-terminal domain-containing protein [Glaciecola pallidula]GAC29857.1 lipopolysaccharide biosynthesis protein [Glaciecola pallidula DSM 14239 = ACAM 615]
MNIDDRVSEIEKYLKSDNITKQSESLQTSSSSDNEEVNLSELWVAIWASKFVVVLFTIAFTSLVTIYAITQPNIYRASAVVMPSGDSGSSGLRGLAGQFGGIASLAGINLGGGSIDKTGIALEVLKSRGFIESFVKKYNIDAELLAVVAWHSENNSLEYDKSLFDASKDEWLIDDNTQKSLSPTNWESYKEFSRILQVSQDIETGMITLSIEHISPNYAKEWLELLILEINLTISENDKREAKSSIEYLTSKLETTQLSDMKSVFYQLIEEQTKTMMLTEVNDEYVFKTIDPPNVPDEKAKPGRAMMIVSGAIIGFGFGVVVVLIRYLKRK